jgi:dynein heavy chain
LTDPGKELHEVAEIFFPIMHTILLIWTYSSNYNTPARLLVLIREICNAIIKQCRNTVDGEKIFGDIKNDVSADAHSKLILACDVCSKFKETYFEFKNKSKNQWKITPSALFVRLDAFSERCQDIMQVTGTIQQFTKLQRIEIGNTKGMTMSATIKQIYEEFQKCIDEFCQVNYDIMNIENL